VFLTSVLASICSIWLYFRFFYDGEAGINELGFLFLWGPFFLLTSGVGLVILLRSTNWQIGWLLAAIGGLAVWSSLSQQYAEYAFQIRPEDTLPLRWLAAWFQNWVPFVLFSLITWVLPQLFPTGTPLSRRWRLVFWLTLIWQVLIALTVAFGKGPLEYMPVGVGVMNPYGFIPFGEFWTSDRGEAIGIGLFFTFSGLAVASLVLRYRRSRGLERQQMKWIVYALSMWIIGFILSITGSQTEVRSLQAFGNIVWYIGIFGLPLVIGFAILKYRLYDIDRIINRTLVYGLLTGSLALLYSLSVVLLQQILPAQSQLTIVLSTLAIAALFSPLRRRIQTGIDKRFYRRKYDAEKVLAAFSASLREDVDVEKLILDLLAVIDESVQPERLSIWLPEPPEDLPARPLKLNH
jgi:hypothetical protein